MELRHEIAEVASAISYLKMSKVQNRAVNGMELKTKKPTNDKKPSPHSLVLCTVLSGLVYKNRVWGCTKNCILKNSQHSFWNKNHDTSLRASEDISRYVDKGGEADKSLYFSKGSKIIKK